jgi:hypothetical protein
MLSIPKNPNLAALVNATVRVNGAAGFVLDRGSGSPRVIISARHVVKEAPASVTITCNRQTSSSYELSCDETADISILAVSEDVGATGLRLIDSAELISLGDEIWSAGFPSGWKGPTAVLSRGIVAGVAEKEEPNPWINVDGSWGCSGGPIGAMTSDGPRVIGIVLGGAGSPNDEIRSAMDDQSFRTYLENQATAIRSKNPAPGWLVISKLLSILGDMIGFFARRINEHYRTGYIHIATADQIRSIL